MTKANDGWRPGVRCIDMQFVVLPNIRDF
jgi:hypothetical protein